MTRALSQAERALWRRVVADVRSARPLPSDAEDVPATAVAPAPQRPAPPVSVPRHTPPLARPHVGGYELDASWEKRLRDGQALPDRVVDLHGLTAAEAHRRAIDAITTGVARGARLILLITGKAPPRGSMRLDQPLRGVIRASLSDWIAASQAHGSVVAVRGAHRRHGGEGAVYVILRRQRAPR